MPEGLGKDPAVKSATADVPSFLSLGVGFVGMAGDSRVDIKETAFDNHESADRQFPLRTRKRKWWESSKGPKRPIIPLFSDDSGAVIGYSSWEKGSVILLADGWPISNRGINKGGNLRMVLNALQRADPNRKLKVTFDEYHHGYGEGEGIMSLIGIPAKLGLLEIGIAFLLLVFASSRRFGRPNPLMEGARQRGEYLSSMASLLRKAQATDLVRAELGGRFLADIAVAVGVAPGSNVDVILSAAQQRYPEKIAVLVELCEAAVSGDSVRGEAAILAMARRWHKMREELK